MATAFNYRPKFVDVRVNKPDGEEPVQRTGERACDHGGCRRGGDHKAPKGRQHEGEYWWFCTEHAGEYNRSFNYFAGMSPDELSAYAQSEITGHRPTWEFKVGGRDRVMGAFKEFQAGRRRDPFSLFDGPGAETAPEPRSARAPRIGRVQMLALEVLGLEPGAPPEAVRERYAALVKRFHPDSNGGDRSMEAQLHKSIRAFQTLRAAGMA